jgi:glycine/D-amino acid oxidase-like deaminating enzyme
MIQPETLDDHAVEGTSLPIDDPLVGDGIAKARAVVPGLAGIAAEAVRHGVRPMPKDGLPIVGFDSSVANLYHVVTHSGITLAARLGLLVTEELAGGDGSPLEPYRPTRFAPGAAVPMSPAHGSSD